MANVPGVKALFQYHDAVWRHVLRELQVGLGRLEQSLGRPAPTIDLRDPVPAEAHKIVPAGAILFDRDSTIAEGTDDPARLELSTDAYAAVQLARDAGLPVGLVSRRRGADRRLATMADARAAHRRIDDLLGVAGPVDTWLVCPIEHSPTTDTGHHPLAVAVREAVARLRIPIEACVYIGSVRDDVAAADRTGARGILVPLPSGSVPTGERTAPVGETAPTLIEAVRRALAGPAPGARAFGVDVYAAGFEPAAH